MSYRELYDFCQSLTPRIKRTQIVEKVCELTRRPRPKIIVDGINPAILRGYFIEAANLDHPFAKFAPANGAVIVVAREMSRCWRRFVTVKEVMHYFDEPLEHVSNADEFATLIGEFVAPAMGKSEPMKAETRAFWMALALLCPERLRQEYERKFVLGEIDPIAIAQELKIPLQYVPSLFDRRFKQNVQLLLSNC